MSKGQGAMENDTVRKRTLRSLFIFVLIALAVASAGYGIVQWRKYQEFKALVLGTRQLEQRISEFEKQPDAYLCFRIIGGYQTHGRNDKALMYGRRCIDELGSDKSEVGWYIRLIVAALYAEEGKDSEAMENLRMAIKIDKENVIEKMHMIKGLPELSAAYAIIKQEKRASP
jgi:hypothetical protein